MTTQVDMTTSRPLTAAEMKAKLIADQADEEAKMLEAFRAKKAKELAKIDDRINDEALAEKNGELVSQLSDFLKAAIPALGIALPEKGLLLDYKPIKIEHGPNGSLMVTIERREKAASTATGERKPRGTGSGSGRATVTSLTPKISTFVIGDESIKSASATLKKVNVDFGSDNPARFMVGWALTNREAANAIIVKREGMADEFLGELIAREYGTPPASPATETEVTAPPALTPPPVTPPASN